MHIYGQQTSIDVWVLEEMPILQKARPPSPDIPYRFNVMLFEVHNYDFRLYPSISYILIEGFILYCISIVSTIQSMSLCYF